MKRSKGIDAPIQALAPWYGCKRTLAPQIIAEIGEHSAYWEPFCGSMAVLFAKHPCRHETVNDLHGDLLNLARVIASPAHAPQLDWQLRRTLVHESLYREAVAFLGDPANMPPIWDSCGDEYLILRARYYFVQSWMGMNGMCGTDQRVSFAKRYTSNGGCPAVRFVGAVDSLPAWHERMRPVTILQGCGIVLCEKIEDKAGTVIYVDPPYVEKTDNYIHDFTLAEHQRLATALQRFTKTRVIVSYYDHPALESLYPGWRKVELRAKKSLATGSKAEAKAAPEVLLINLPKGK